MSNVIEVYRRSTPIVQSEVAKSETETYIETTREVATALNRPALLPDAGDESITLSAIGAGSRTAGEPGPADV